MIKKKKGTITIEIIYFFPPYILFIFHLPHLATILLFTGKRTINFRIERRNYTRSIAIFVFSWNKTPIMRRFVSPRDLENDIYVHHQCLLKGRGGRSYMERNGGCIDSIENLRTRSIRNGVSKRVLTHCIEFIEDLDTS